MIAVLHLGPFDGAQFDLRQWEAAPDHVFAQKGGHGKLRVQLFRDSSPGTEAYKFVVNNSQDEYHYRWAGGNGDEAAAFFVDHELEDLRHGT